MSKRYDLLDELKDCSLSGTGLRRGDSIVLDVTKVRELLYKLQEYYLINDLETGRQHGEIFTVLYINETFSSYDSIANQFYIQPFTLNRYRRRYNRLAKKLILRDAEKQGVTSQKV